MSYTNELVPLAKSVRDLQCNSIVYQLRNISIRGCIVEKTLCAVLSIFKAIFDLSPGCLSVSNLFYFSGDWELRRKRRSAKGLDVW